MPHHGGVANLLFPEPDPELLVDVELLSGEGVASCGDRSGTIKSIDPTDCWSYKCVVNQTLNENCAAKPTQMIGCKNTYV